MKPLFLTVLPLLAIILSACSPHPASGTWTAPGASNDGINKVVVMYEGRAELFSPASEEALWRCFWGGKSKQNIAMECVFAANTDIESRFTLDTQGGDKATLRKAGEFVAEFSKTAEQ
ncbi:MAG: hypothetical protein C0631_17705 [Sedimenticola sp.]|nr:MAG: hypothetical protein C0631_17705 [Sedimenticola sp.]